jgi:hypothetical protein
MKISQNITYLPLELHKMLELPRRLSVSDWAEKNIYFNTQTSPIAGFFKKTTAPYMTLPLDLFGTRHIKAINFYSGSQLAKTTTIFIMVAYKIVNDPSPALLFFPQEELAKRTATDRLKPLLTSCEATAALIEEIENQDQRKRSDWAVRYTGGFVMALSLESPANRKSTPAKYLFADEIAEMDAAKLAEAMERVKAYDRAGSKLITASTCLTASDPVVTRHKTFSCALEWNAVCPDCGHSFEIEFERDIKFPTLAEFGEDSKETGSDLIALYRARASRNARVACPSCGSLWDDQKRVTATKNGFWRVMRGDYSTDNEVSFRISSLHSTLTSLESIVKAYITADTQENAEERERLLEKFYVGYLAKPYDRLERAAMPLDDIYQIKTNQPRGIVPEDAVALVMTIDVQQDYYWFVVMAIRWRGNVHIVDHGRLFLDEEISRRLTGLTGENGEIVPFYRTDKAPRRIDIAGIDSRFRTEEVFNLCINHPALLYPLRGQETIRNQSRTTITHIDKNQSVGAGLTIVNVNNAYFDRSLDTKIRLSVENSKGAKRDGILTAHAEMDNALARHLTNVVPLNNAKTQYAPKSESARVDLWDCCRYALAFAIHFCGDSINFAPVEDEPQSVVVPTQPPQLSFSELADNLRNSY